jgi:hypothetical protein
MSIQLAKLGDVVPGTFADIILLQAFVSADGNVSHLRLPFATSGYQVTAGKSLYLAKVHERGTGNPGWWKFGYADNDVGFNTTTARTNPVMSIGVDDTGSNGWNNVPVNYTGAALITPVDFLWKLSIAAKYPFVRRVGATPTNALFLWCFEL